MKSPSSYSLIVLLAIGVSIVGLWGQSPSDDDGMDDAWEISMGLNPNDATDAFSDLDGDRVPNLWEYARGTSANDANSMPVFDAVVCRFPVPASLPPQFGTLQEAYDALPSTAGYYSVVHVQRGDYPAVLDGATTPRRVAWIAESGVDRATGLEGATLKPLAFFEQNITVNNDTLILNEETVIDGFIIDGRTAGFVNPTIQAVTQTSAPTEIRLANTTVRNWFASSTPPGIAGGTIKNQGCVLWLVHCSLSNSAAFDNNTSTALGMIDNQTGSELHCYNTLIWDPYLGASASILTGDLDAVWGDACILNGAVTIGYGLPGQLTNASEADPLFTYGGYLQAGSPAINAAGARALAKDIYNQSRPAGDEDIGAMEWISTDSDTLPDWWEVFWFGNLSQGSDDNPDNDWSTNLDCYLYGYGGQVRPTPDQDGDGLWDWWEIDYFERIEVADGDDNPDGDWPNNLQEQTAETNPTVFQADWDNDGMTDALEVSSFGDLAEAALGDVDNDGLSNLMEIMVLFSNPDDEDTNDDGFNDGLAYMLGLNVLGDDTDGDGLTNTWEQAHGTSYFLVDSDGDGVADDEDELPLDPLASTGNSIAGPPVITLTAPASAVLVP